LLKILRVILWKLTPDPPQMIDKIRQMIAENPLFAQLFRFGVLGVVSVIAEFSLLFFLKDYIGLDLMIANRIAFGIVLLANYWASRAWVFGSGTHSSQIEFVIFVGVSLVGLAINELLLPQLVYGVQFDEHLSKLLTIGVVVVWNFIMKRLVVFKKATT
jgi:putative flippase GtrA